MTRLAESLHSWAIKPGHYDDDFPAAGYKTKRVTMPIGADPTVGSQAAFTDYAQRYLVWLPVATTRWRLRIRNPGNNGAISLSDVYKGTPSFTDSGWSGTTTGGGVGVLSGLSMPSDGSDYTTGWVIDPTAQFAANVPATLSLGFTVAGGQAVVKSSEYGSFTWLGAGASASANNATPTGSSFNNARYLDVRLEYEFFGANPVVLCIGDSVTAGLYDDLWTNIASQNAAWPGIAGMRERFCWINLGSAQKDYTSFDQISDTHYQRLDLATTVPDVAIIALGINDAGVSLATFQARVKTTVDMLRNTIGIPRVQVCTVIPQPRWKPGRLLAAAAIGATTIQTDVAYANADAIILEPGSTNTETVTASGASSGSVAPFTTTVGALTKNHGISADTAIAPDDSRRSFNKWLRSGVPNAEVVDFANAVGAPGNRNVGNPEFYGGGTIHPGAAAHIAMAELIRVAI